MGSIRVAIVGVGNCAASLVQGVHYYRDADPRKAVPGLMHVDFGGYHVRDIEFVAAFDVDSKKVGLDLADAIEFRRRLHVDGTHPRAEGRLDLGLGLPDAGEDDLRRIAAGREDAGEFPAGDDVEAEALPREEVEDREVPVRLHREADEVRATGEGGLEGVGDRKSTRLNSSH